MAEKSNNNPILVLVIVLVVLGVFYFINSDTIQKGEVATGPLRLGVITPLTGDAAVYGTAMQRAYDLAVEQINSSGGVSGRNVELLYQDGKCDGTAATSSAQKLTSVDNVKFILGGACSGETLAAAEITQQARVLLISPSATSPDITNAGDLVFRTYPSDAFEGKMMAAYAKDTLELSKAAVISENTDYAQGIRKVFTEQFGQDGEVVFDETFNTGDTDFRTLITKMKTSIPDVVYVIPQAPASGELILKQMKEAGLDASRFAGNSMLDTDAFAENPSLYEGLVLAQVELDENNEKTSKLFSSFDDKYEDAMTYPSFTAAAYDSVYLIKDAIESVGEDSEKVAEYFNTDVNDWAGSIGVFNFDENGDAVIDLSLVSVMDGELKPVDLE